MLHFVHSSLIYNSQKLERTQMFHNRRMDTENVVQWSTTQLLKNDFMKFAGKWMELENINLSEITQSQKNTHDIYSLISVYTISKVQIT